MDLYQSPIKSPFVSYCGGNQQEENNESCVAVAPIDGGFALKDTKAGSPDTALCFTGAEMDTFARRWVSERGLI